MPKESFYDPSVVEGEQVEFAHARAVNVAWGTGKTSDTPRGVWIAGGVALDESAIERLIATLKRARRQVFPREIMPGVFESDNEPLVANPYAVD